MNKRRFGGLPQLLHNPTKTTKVVRALKLFFPWRNTGTHSAVPCEQKPPPPPLCASTALFKPRDPV